MNNFNCNDSGVLTNVVISNDNNFINNTVNSTCDDAKQQQQQQNTRINNYSNLIVYNNQNHQMNEREHIINWSSCTTPSAKNTTTHEEDHSSINYLINNNYEIPPMAIIQQSSTVKQMNDNNYLPTYTILNGNNNNNNNLNTNQIQSTISVSDAQQTQHYLTDIPSNGNIAINQSITQSLHQNNSFDNPQQSITTTRMIVVGPPNNNPRQLELEEKCSKFICKEMNCNRSYSTISGLNIHLKKKHSSLSSTSSSSYPCDECSDTFFTSPERTMHKIQIHEGRRYHTERHNQKMNNHHQFVKLQSTQNENDNQEIRNLKQPQQPQQQQQSQPQASLLEDTQLQLLPPPPPSLPSLPSPPHKCLQCGDLFNHKNDLIKHVRNRHTSDNGEYPCTECSKVYYTFDMYKEHCSLHDDTVPKHKCAECGKQFISQRKLKEHSIIHQERTMFKCDVCSKVFVRSQTLQYHRITCKAAYPCDNCVDSFMTREALEKHKSFHKVDQNFTCIKCNKVFSSQKALDNHEKRHSLRMNYTCQICKESISTRAKFQKHIKDHLETNLRCGVCNEVFQSLVKYGYHKAEMHSIMRPYDCVLCTDEFCTRQELFIHLHNHTGKSTTTTTTTTNTNTTSTETETTNTLLNVTTTKNLYQCKNCQKKFPIKLNYQQHLKSCKMAIRKNFDVDHELYDDYLTSSCSSSSSLLSTSSGRSFVLPTSPYLELPPELLLPAERVPITKQQQQHQQQKRTTKLLASSANNTSNQMMKMCPIESCSQTFTNEYDLKQHKIQLHNNSSLGYQQQFTKQQPNNIIICKYNDICKCTFKNQADLKKHLPIHLLKSYKCDKCQRIYYSESVFKTHSINICNDELRSQQNIKNDSDKSNVPKMTDRYGSTNNINDNDDIDSGPIECELCKQLFENKKVLKFHGKFCFDPKLNDLNMNPKSVEMILTTNGNNGVVDHLPKQLIEEIYVKPEIDEIDLLNIVPEY